MLRTLIGLTGALFTLTVMGLSVFATSQKPDIRGKVASVTRADNKGSQIETILVKADRKADSQFDQASIRITRETRFFEEDCGKRYKLKFALLQKDDLVEVRFTGPVMESYPVQATASEITILRGCGRTTNK